MICFGENITVGSNTYNNSATYTTINAEGCDSTITLDLTINNSDPISKGF